MSGKTISIQETNTNLHELLSLVREGTEIILMKGDTPLARIAPIEGVQNLLQEPTLQTRILGLHAHLGPARTSDDFDDPLPDEFWLGDA